MKLSAKLFSTVAACGMVLSLAACGNTSKTSSAKSEAVQSSRVTKKHNSNKENANKGSQKTSASNNSSLKTSSSSNVTSGSTSSDRYSVTATSESANGSSKSASVVKKQSASQQATMNATDAKNIVKEHIGNQLNNRGVAGQSTSDLPSIDSIDGYTATQNGTNNWTVSGNGHTYNVTASSVTGN